MMVSIIEAINSFFQLLTKLVSNKKKNTPTTSVNVSGKNNHTSVSHDNHAVIYNDNRIYNNYTNTPTDTSKLDVQNFFLVWFLLAFGIATLIFLWGFHSSSLTLFLFYVQLTSCGLAIVFALLSSLECDGHSIFSRTFVKWPLLAIPFILLFFVHILEFSIPIFNILFSWGLFICLIWFICLQILVIIYLLTPTIISEEYLYLLFSRLFGVPTFCLLVYMLLKIFLKQWLL